MKKAHWFHILKRRIETEESMGAKENVCDREDNGKIILEKVAERDQKG